MNHALETLSYTRTPLVLVVSDNAAGFETATDAALALGARVGVRAGVKEDLFSLSRTTGFNAVLAEISCLAEPDIAFDALQRLAEDERIPSIVNVPVSQIDHAMARLPHANITILCDATPIERAAALGVALSPADTLLRDANTDVESLRLQRLADEVARIAKALSSLSTPSAYPMSGPHSGGVSDVHTRFEAEPMLDMPAITEVRAADLRNMIKLRRLRDRFFDSALFADPAWDMLLDLMAARLEQVQVAVSSLCIAAAVPPTTALRWIKSMTDAGLFERISDPDDGRRIFIRLSETAAIALQRYFAAANLIPTRMI
jgi:hypothetical protein